jgi:outer membrane protein assembly factor BamB
MNRRILLRALLPSVLAAALQACTGGGDALVCRLDNPPVLAASAWPKFRHDQQNTGAANVALGAVSGRLLWVFPPLAEDPKGPFAASPVLNGTASDPPSLTRIYIGSTDGNMYAIRAADGTADPSFDFRTTLPITSTALLGVRNGVDAIYFGGGDGILYGLDPDAEAQATNWPSAIDGFLSASPTIITDGTLYVGAAAGFFAGVCPNGVARFFLPVVGSLSSPAAGTDDTLYFGADDHQLRAVRLDGVSLWAFSAAGPILSAPVVETRDDTTAAIYVADRSGRIFKVDSSGRPVDGFSFEDGGIVGPFRSSPALAGGRLYVGSDDGNLYAVDTTSGSLVWSFATGDAVTSSPAVALGDGQPVIVVGSNDGNLYFIRDDGDSPTAIATFPIGAPVRSSPALGADGTVYVGADDGRVYAIR